MVFQTSVEGQLAAQYYEGVTTIIVLIFGLL